MEDGERWVVLDGDLFDRARIGRAHGSSLDPALDDATWLLGIFKERGPSILGALEGAYALVLWDGEALWLARDAMGQVPLHYRVDQGRTDVATWPRSLAGRRPRLEEAALVDFALLLDDDPALSFFAGVTKLAPGDIAVSRAPGSVEIVARYRPRLSAAKVDFEEACVETRRLVDAAVAALVADGSGTALSLSSGLDSNILLASVARQSIPALAIAAGPAPPFDSQEGHVDDERALARESAAALGIDFLAVEGPATALAELPHGFERCERPLFNPSNLGWLDEVTSCAAREGRNLLLHGLNGNFTVTWTGEGSASGALFQRDLAGLVASLRDPGGAARGAQLRALAVDHAPRFVRTRRAMQQRDRVAETLRLRPSDIVRERIERAIAAGQMPHRWNDRIAAPDVRLHSQIRGIDLANVAKGYERRAGVRYRDALGQRALAEWCVSLPARIYAHRGETRRLGRALLDPRAPKAIRDQAALAVQGANWRRAMERDLPLAKRWIARARDDAFLSASFDLDWLERVVGTWPSDGWHDPAYHYDYRVKPQRLLTALGFALWVEDLA